MLNKSIASDRRREPRTEVDLEVILRVDGPFEKEFAGKLIDVSDSGFRTIHSRQDLSSHQVVQFRHALASGRARMAWKRIDPANPLQVDSGFMVLQFADTKPPLPAPGD